MLNQSPEDQIQELRKLVRSLAGALAEQVNDPLGYIYRSAPSPGDQAAAIAAALDDTISQVESPVARIRRDGVDNWMQTRDRR